MKRPLLSTLLLLLAMILCATPASTQSASGQDKRAAQGAKAQAAKANQANNKQANAAKANRPAAAKGPVRRALLVGVETYSRKDSGWTPLTGPTADVAALRQVLIDRAGFLPENIRVLRDKQATRANILGSMRKLVDDASKNDVLLFYFSGHGSQLADDNGDEKGSDGLDETLVPHDAVKKNGERNDIRDDEVERFIARANQKTNHVVLVFDCCNSGTVSRGSNDSKKKPKFIERFVKGDEKDMTERGFAGKRLSNNSGGAARSIVPAEAKFTDALHFPKTLSYVQLGACRSHQTAAEISLPTADGEKRVHGIFTYSLVKQLHDVETGWTYKDLNNEVRAAVREVRPSQTPVMMGNLANRSLFGGGIVPDEPFYTLARDEKGGFQLLAGLVNGVHQGSVFHVMPPSATEDDPSVRLGRIRTTKVSANRSEIEWIQKKPSVDKMKRGRFRAFESERGTDAPKLRVAIREPQTFKKELIEELGGLIREQYDMRLVADLEDAHLIVRRTKRDKIVRLEASHSDGTPLPVSVRTDGNIPFFVKKLAALAARHRVLSIRKETSRSLCIDADVIRLDKRKKPIGPPELDDMTGIPTLPVGQKFACQIKNCSDVPVFTSLLVISPDGQIAVVWKTSEDEPIPPGRVRESPPFTTYISKNAENFYRVAPEVFRFVVTTEPHDLSNFEQKAVTEMRPTRGAERGFTSEPEGTLSGKERLVDSWMTVTLEIQTTKES